MVGLVALVHIKYGTRFFILMFGCILLWNLWGYGWIKEPQFKIPWKFVASFACTWIFIFTTSTLYTLNLLTWFSEIEVPKVPKPSMCFVLVGAACHRAGPSTSSRGRVYNRLQEQGAGHGAPGDRCRYRRVRCGCGSARHGDYLQIAVSSSPLAALLPSDVACACQHRWIGLD